MHQAIEKLPKTASVVAIKVNNHPVEPKANRGMSGLASIVKIGENSRMGNALRSMKQAT